MSNYDYNVLCHHGIKGQKWGIRRYQNEDGSLTIEGKKRYGSGQYAQAAKEFGKTYDSKKLTEMIKQDKRYTDYLKKNKSILEEFQKLEDKEDSMEKEKTKLRKSDEYDKELDKITKKLSKDFKNDEYAPPGSDRFDEMIDMHMEDWLDKKLNFDPEERYSSLSEKVYKERHKLGKSLTKMYYYRKISPDKFNRRTIGDTVETAIFELDNVGRNWDI